MGLIIQKLVSKPLLPLFFIYCLFSIYLFHVYGVKIVNDSERYLGYAKNLQHGFYFDTHNFWYFTYSLFIYCLHFINDSVLFIIISQYIVGFFAVFSLYKTYLLLFNDKTGAFITGLAYILFTELITWNSYILCESLFCSLTCVSLYLLAKLFKGDYSISLVCTTTIVVLLTVLTKPTGIALLGAIAIVLLFRAWKNISSIVLKILLSTFLIIGSLLLVNQMLTTFLLVENYITGDIIYAASTLPNLKSTQYVVVLTPENLFIPSTSLQPLLRLLLFIVNNFVFWAQLFLLKITYFISHVRPYWSWKHNIFSLAFLIPFYFLTIKNLIKNTIHKELRLFALSYLLLHTFIIGITSVDWDGRFLMPLLPILFLLGTYSLRKLHISKINQ